MLIDELLRVVEDMPPKPGEENDDAMIADHQLASMIRQRDQLNARIEQRKKQLEAQKK